MNDFFIFIKVLFIAVWYSLLGRLGYPVPDDSPYLCNLAPTIWSFPCYVIRQTFTFLLGDRHYQPELYRCLSTQHFDLAENLIAIDCGLYYTLPIHANSSVLQVAVVYHAPKRLIQQLLAKGLDVNYRNLAGKTSLHFAVRVNSSISIMRLLIDSGGDLNLPDTLGRTPIMLAARRDRSLNILTLMLSRGADMNRKDFEGWRNCGPKSCGHPPWKRKHV